MSSSWQWGSIRRVSKSGLVFIALWVAGSSAALADPLLGIRTGRHGDSLRVVLDIENGVACSLRPVKGSNDWIIEVSDGCPSDPPSRIENPHPLLRAIEAECRGRVLEVSLLAAHPNRAHAFYVSARGGKPLRYVVDLYPEGKLPPPSPPEAPQPEPQPRRTGPWRIVIDPGHGGRDPGATARGIKEKEVVLDVGRRIVEILDRSPGFEARMTRATDRFIDLRNRKVIAEDYEADAFLSIHANAARKSRAVGVEVFFLSLGGASDEASRELARLENEADPDYVVEEDALLEEIPFGFDLRQTDTIRRSSRLAESVLTALETSGLAASRGVKQAGFVVLKSFQVPSILVEIGFLSNPNEAKRLKTVAHRQRLAETIAGGTVSYFERFARARAQEGPGGQ
jgi:N-acetylmuramoyl-L-alanine amidase